MIQPAIAMCSDVYFIKWYFLVGLKVFSNPGIVICENGTEYTAESKMMVNDTTAERNVTCFMCGKPYLRKSLITTNQLILIWLFCTHTADLSGTTSFFVSSSAAVTLLFAFIRLLMETSQFCYDRKGYISDRTNFPEVLLYILSIIFVSVFWTPCMCPQKWQWQIGVIAVLLAWIYLIRFCAKFPSTGIYIIMFGKIVLTFLNVIVLSMLLLATFAITFHMTFSEEQFQVSHLQKEPASNLTSNLTVVSKPDSTPKRSL